MALSLTNYWSVVIEIVGFIMFLGGKQVSVQYLKILINGRWGVAQHKDPHECQNYWLDLSVSARILGSVLLSFWNVHLHHGCY